MALMLSSCISNNGAIGIWFGEWKIESITWPDGSPFYMPTEHSALFFAFQNTTVRLTLSTDGEYSDAKYGNWSVEDDVMTISFPDVRWQPFAESGLSGIEGGVLVPNVMHISYQSSKKVVMTQQTAPFLTFTLIQW